MSVTLPENIPTRPSQTDLQQLIFSTTNQQPRAVLVYGADNIKNRSIRDFVYQHAKVMQPDRIHVCDGSEHENELILKQLEQNGMIQRLSKYPNWLVIFFLSAAPSRGETGGGGRGGWLLKTLPFVVRVLRFNFWKRRFWNHMLYTGQNPI